MTECGRTDLLCGDGSVSAVDAMFFETPKRPVEDQIGHFPLSLQGLMLASYPHF